MPLDLDAGDFIIDHGTVIVDTNLLDKNRHRGIGDVIELRKRLAAWLRAPVIVIGKEPGDTPRHHIAMYMTPLQEKVMLVGDPKAAKAIVGERAPLRSPIIRTRLSHLSLLASLLVGVSLADGLHGVAEVLGARRAVADTWVDTRPRCALHERRDCTVPQSQSIAP